MERRGSAHIIGRRAAQSGFESAAVRGRLTPGLDAALLMPAVDETRPFVDPFVRYQTLRALQRPVAMHQPPGTRPHRSHWLIVT